VIVNCNGICPHFCHAICLCMPILEPAVRPLLPCVYSFSIPKTGQRKRSVWYPQRTNTVAVYTLCLPYCCLSCSLTGLTTSLW
jgi:hypothetical protein